MELSKRLLFILPNENRKLNQIPIPIPIHILTPTLSLSHRKFPAKKGASFAGYPNESSTLNSFVCLNFSSN